MYPDAEQRINDPFNNNNIPSKMVSVEVESLLG